MKAFGIIFYLGVVSVHLLSESHCLSIGNPSGNVNSNRIRIPKIPKLNIPKSRHSDTKKSGPAPSKLSVLPRPISSSVLNAAKAMLQSVRKPTTLTPVVNDKTIKFGDTATDSLQANKPAIKLGATVTTIPSTIPTTTAKVTTTTATTPSTTTSTTPTATTSTTPSTTTTTAITQKTTSTTTPSTTTTASMLAVGTSLQPGDFWFNNYILKEIKPDLLDFSDSVESSEEKKSSKTATTTTTTTSSTTTTKDPRSVDITTVTTSSTTSGSTVHVTTPAISSTTVVSSTTVATTTVTTNSPSTAATSTSAKTTITMQMLGGTAEVTSPFNPSDKALVIVRVPQEPSLTGPWR